MEEKLIKLMAARDELRALVRELADALERLHDELVHGYGDACPTPCPDAALLTRAREVLK